jgi:hypothetical protein
MIQWLPYLFLGLLLLAVLAWWVWDAIVHRSTAELLTPRQLLDSSTNVGSRRDLGERIFGPQDWDFVLRETPSQIQRVFHRERTVLALAWLRRMRTRTSQVMHAHVAVARKSEHLQIGMELRLALTYVFFLILCNSLIGWVWLRGPVRTRKIVRQTLHWVASQRTAFGRFMAVVDPASHRVLETGFTQGTTQS